MGSITWWVKIIAITIFALFLFSLSIVKLLETYTLNNPIEFVMSFFSNSFMLLISIVGLIYPIMQLYYYLKKQKVE